MLSRLPELSGGEGGTEVAPDGNGRCRRKTKLACAEWLGFDGTG
jgi:hypothetical protein